MTDPFRTVELSDPQFESEGLRLATVKSPALRRRADATIWVPPAPAIDHLLILLHGVYGSHWVWSQKAGVHRTAARLLATGAIAPLVIIMPSDGHGGDGSGYLPGSPFGDIERWIVDEVPALARLAAPALTPAPRLSIAGLSMGGYGALRLGAKYAHRFASISAHSAITDIPEIQSFVEDPLAIYLRCAPRDDLNPLFWIRRHRASLPALRFDCGLDDPLLEPNRRLHRALETDRIPHIHQEFPGGHSWPYWQQHVAETLRFTSQAASRQSLENQ